MSIAAGSRFGRYEILNPIGKGGMGEVYLARDPSLDRRLALKVLPAHFTADPDRVRRFEQEARAASALNQPNIITVYEIGEAEGIHFIAMEFIEGRTLRAQVADARLGVRAALDVASQVASALAAAHAAGIVHRDIKPENIILRPDGLVKVLDFGLAKLAEPKTLQDTNAATTPFFETGPATVLGTLGYMAPEQLRALEADARSDLFSLGVVLYEMVAGRAPFAAGAPAEVIAAILDREPPSLARLCPEAPEALEWIVTKLLRKEREERFQTARELLTDLRALKQRLELQSELERAAQPQPAALGAEPPARRRLGLAIAAGAAALAAAAIVYFAVSIQRGSETNRAPAQRELTRFTFDAGLQNEPTWSPDGRFIAYSSDRSGNFEIYVQQVGEGSAIQVSRSTAHDWQPDWSPDGKLIVFRSERDGGGLFVVPMLGGSERKIAPFGFRPRWSPDGSRILFLGSNLRIGTIPKVYVVALDGTPPREVLADFLTPSRYAQYSFRHVGWHPDGRRLSVWTQQKQAGWGLWTVPVDGGTPLQSEVAPQVAERIKTAGLTFSFFVWAPSGRTLFLEGTARGVTNLWKVAVDPRTLRWISGPERLTTGAGRDTEVALSADGKKLAFTTRRESTRVWVMPFDAATGKVTGDAQPATATGIDVLGFDLTRDGKKLAYLANRPGKQELWEKSLEGGAEKLLVAADGSTRSYPYWSRDGTRLAYRRTAAPKPGRDGRGTSIVFIGAGAGDEQVVTSPGTFGDGPTDWSADGSWLLGVTTGLIPDRFAIWRVPLAAAPHGETQAQVLQSSPEYNFFQPHLSPDERWVCFMAVKAGDPAVSTISVIPASGGERKPISDGKNYDDKLRWSPDGRTIYFVSPRGGFFNVWGIRFDSRSGAAVGEPFRVTSFESPARMVSPVTTHSEIALAAGRLALPVMEVSGNIWILENIQDAR